ncbi:hypothetical protein BHE74_00010446 [Ensete ventricosum]|nr:hypothetical protein BHE74_00010446 [Ensete ventricosum]
MAESASQSSDPAKGEELRDLVQRFMASLAEFSRRLPFDVDLQQLALEQLVRHKLNEGRKVIGKRQILAFNLFNTERVLSALDDSGVFTAGGLIREKVLFCGTENGRISFVRQLEPDWHVDTNAEIIHQLTFGAVLW